MQYYGPPGIALYFLQLLDRVGGQGPNPALYAAAQRAGDRIVVTLDDALAAFGSNTALYYGSAGLAFALRELAARTPVPALHAAAEFLASARHVEDSVLAAASAVGTNGTTWSNNTDIAHGASGTGLYLLHAATAETDQAHAAKMTAAAVAAGEWLLTMAVPTPGGGLKWPRGKDSDGGHDGVFYPNFCCGTAGVAYFLATLHQATSDPRFLEAAVRGGDFLLSVANRTTGLLIFHDEPAHESMYYLGWCHGPAGTSRLWVRLYQVTGDVKYWDLVLDGATSIACEAVPAFRWLLDTPEPTVAWANAGQCCGGAAALNFLLQITAYASQRGLPTRDLDTLKVATKLADNLARRAVPCGAPKVNGTCFRSPEEHGTPSVLTTQVGWMQGAAGIAASLVHYDAVAVAKSTAGTRFNWPDEPWTT